MKLSVVQESNARRSPYPGMGLNGKEIDGEGNRNGVDSVTGDFTIDTCSMLEVLHS